MRRRDFIKGAALSAGGALAGTPRARSAPARERADSLLAVFENGPNSLDFHAVGANFPAIQDIMKYVVDKGKSETPKEKVGENLYNRGVYNSMLIAEAIRNAQKITGKKAITGEDMRRGLETLNVTAARLKEIGMDGFAAPVQISCNDHNGHHKVFVAQWDGTKWVKSSDWMDPIKDKVRPLIEAAAKDYAEKNAGWPKRTETCDKTS